MKRFDLCGEWRLLGGGYDCIGTVPGSLYSFLLENSLIPDPHFGDNELKITPLTEQDYTFFHRFDFKKSESGRVLLCCNGLDTLCEIYLNGQKIAYTDNMHRSYEFDVSDVLLYGENLISLKFLSVNSYIKQMEDIYGIGVNLPDLNCLIGYPYVRKAHSMMGWDWGPRLPDCGIWRDIYLLIEDSARLDDIRITQRHDSGRVFVKAKAEYSGRAELSLKLISPSGEEQSLQNGIECEVREAELWWPNGLGEQPLYTVSAELTDGRRIADSIQKRIGFREMKLIRQRDEFGESFYHEVNGVGIFAMGANYIPEDNIFSRITPERSRRLLEACKECNFNTIRVWGGGYYLDDWFYDMCDELGLLVFHDLMFACTVYNFNDAFKQNVMAEIEQNVKRIRHHACIALICGNNEIEMLYEHYKKAEYKQMYLDMFEGEIPRLLEKLCPEIPYITSSPTSFGGFNEPNHPDFGECHYWEPWFGDKPFSEYRKYHFRYLSEFGFQALPDEKTVNSFTNEADRNIFSRVMELHQRCGPGGGYIVKGISRVFKYPTDFGTLLYASQLLQAKTVRYGVEHFRRKRGRCMGALYWQLNDIWPAVSWSSIDSCGRYKALQYSAKRFFAPVLISCCEVGETDTRQYVSREPGFYDFETKAHLCVTNDTLSDVEGKACWELRSSRGELLRSGEQELKVPRLSAVWLEELNFNKTDIYHNYLSFSFVSGGRELSAGSALFTAEKHFEFCDPKLSYILSDNRITIKSEAFAQSVEIYSPDSDFILEDNFFDMNAGEKTVRVLRGTPKTIKLRSVYDIH